MVVEFLSRGKFFQFLNQALIKLISKNVANDTVGVGGPLPCIMLHTSTKKFKDSGFEDSFSCMEGSSTETHRFCAGEVYSSRYYHFMWEALEWA